MTTNLHSENGSVMLPMLFQGFSELFQSLAREGNTPNGCYGFTPTPFHFPANPDGAVIRITGRMCGRFLSTLLASALFYRLAALRADPTGCGRIYQATVSH